MIWLLLIIIVFLGYIAQKLQDIHHDSHWDDD